MAGEVIDLRGKLTTVILLNRYSTKLLSKCLPFKLKRKLQLGGREVAYHIPFEPST